MKILMINHSLKMGGSPISMYEMSMGLRERGWTIDVSTESDGTIGDWFRSHNFNLHIIKRSGGVSLLTIARYFMLMRRGKYDLVHLNTCTSYFKYPAIAAYLSRIKVIWWCREDVRDKRIVRLYGWFRLLSTCFITVSKEQQTNILMRTNLLCTKVFYKGIPDGGADKYEKCHEISSNRPTNELLIGYIGSIEKRKGVKELLLALLKISEKLKFKVYIIGAIPSSEYYNDLLKIAASERLKDRVVFLGEKANARAYLKCFDVFVFPTYWDCCARVLIEAMDARCPIITTDAGGSPEILPANSAIFVEPQKVDSLASAILNFSALTPDSIREMVNTAYDAYSRRLRLSRSIDEVSQYYSEIVLGHIKHSKI